MLEAQALFRGTLFGMPTWMVFYVAMAIVLLIVLLPSMFVIFGPSDPAEVLAVLKPLGFEKPGDVVNDEAGGISFQRRYVRHIGARGRRDYYVEVEVPAPFDGNFHVSHRGLQQLWVNLGRVLRLDVLRTGDPFIDDQLIVEGYPKDRLTEFFRTPGVQRAVQELFASRVDGIWATGGLVKVRYSYGLDGLVIDRALTARAAEHLAAFASQLPPPIGQSLSGGVRKSLLPTCMFVIIAALFGEILAPAAMRAFPVLDRPGIWGWSWAIGLIIFAAVLSMNLRWLAGQAFVAGHLPRLIAFGTFCSGGLGAVLLICANGWLDRGLTTVHRTQVEGRYDYRVVGDLWLIRSRSSPLRIAVASWRPHRSSELVFVDRAVYDRSVPNWTFATVVTRPGALGFEWVSAPVQVESWPLPSAVTVGETDRQHVRERVSELLAADTETREAWEFFALAEQATGAGLAEKAIQLWQSGLRLDPMAFRQRVALASVLRQQNRTSEAIEQLAVVLRHTEDQATINEARAVLKTCGVSSNSPVIAGSDASQGD